LSEGKKKETIASWDIRAQRTFTCVICNPKERTTAIVAGIFSFYSAFFSPWFHSNK
jgi:hypothetical protein